MHEYNVYIMQKIKNLKPTKGESEHWVVRKKLHLYIYEHLTQITYIHHNLHTLDIWLSQGGTSFAWLS